METKSTLSPNEFKALYKNPLIESVKIRRRQTGVHVPIVFAEIIDVTGDLMVYYYHEGFGIWQLAGVDQDHDYSKT